MVEKYKKVAQELKSSSNKPPFQLIIDINTKLHIEISEFSSKIKCELIGIKEGKYLITTLPLLFDSSFVDKCNEAGGIDIICRYVFKGIAYGFKSNILGIVTTPIQIMVIEYPKEAEICNIRRQQRMTLLLPCRIKFGTTMFYASVLDISNEGCQMVVLKSTISKKDIEMILSISPNNVCVILKLPGSEKDILLPAIRKNYRMEETKVCFGMEFNNVPKESMDLLKGFTAELQKFSV